MLVKSKQLIIYLDFVIIVCVIIDNSMGFDNLLI